MRTAIYTSLDMNIYLGTCGNYFARCVSTRVLCFHFLFSMSAGGPKQEQNRRWLACVTAQHSSAADLLDLKPE